MRYGYARVSSRGQQDNNSLEIQAEALRETGAEEIVSECYTGTKMDRPQLSKLLAKLEPGDTLMIMKLDRFARATEASKVIKDLVDRGIRVHILNMGIIDGSTVGKLVLNILFAFAEYERDSIVERTQSGIAKKRENEPNWKEGRPCREYPDFEKIAQKQKDGNITVAEACKQLGVSRTQWYRMIKNVA